MWALIGAVALAGPWNVTRLYAGTDIVGNTGDVAVGVSVMGWSPLNRLYFVIERETPKGLSRTHHLSFGTMDCPTGWDTCGPLVLEDVGVPQDDKFNLTAMALEPGPDPLDEPTVHLVRSVLYNSGCVEPVRQLEEWTRTPDGVWSDQQIHRPGACGDAQLSHAVVGADQLWACWTVDPVGGGMDDNIWCGTRPLDGAGDTGDTGLVAPTWSKGGLVNGVYTQDHSWFVVANGERVLVHRDKDPSPAVTRLRVTNGPGGPLPASNPNGKADFPSIAQAPDGTFHAVWVEDLKRLAYARCLQADCTDATAWAVQPRPVRFLAPGTVEHPEIAIAGNGRMFVIWSEDHDPANTESRRIHLKQKCPSDPMFTRGVYPGDVLHDLGASPNDQTLLVGRPHMWVDDATSTVHVVWLEKDIPGGDPIHGDVYWAWRTFNPC